MKKSSCFLLPKNTPSDMKEGVVHQTTRSGELTILKYSSSVDVDVLFKETGNVVKGVSAGNIRKGAVADPFAKTLFNIGYLGIGKFNFSNHRAAYNKWFSMLYRSYGGKYHSDETKRSYSDCSVVEHWHSFQNFAAWYYKQPFCSSLGYELDKDLLVKGNKIYSPDRCLLIPKELNSFLSSNLSGKMGPGIQKQRGRYFPSVSLRGKRTYFGGYASVEEATSVYDQKKRETVLKLTDLLYEEKRITTQQRNFLYDRYDCGVLGR